MPILLAPMGVATAPTFLLPAAPPAFDPFAGPIISHLVPLTESQAEIWLACQLGGRDANCAYNESITLRLRGPLGRKALEQAVRTLVSRHEALRLAFSADGKYGYVVQDLDLPLDYENLEPNADPASQATAYEQRQVREPFDLLRGPLLRVGLLRLAAEEHHLVLTAHHLVCDGWSVSLLLRELSALYSAHRLGQPAALPVAEAFGRYADRVFVESQQPAYRATEQFWRHEFRGEVPILSLPTDFARPAQRTYQSARADFALAPELALGLKQVARQAACTFTTALLAAFEVFLHHLTGQDELVVGLPTAGQSATQLLQLVGHCVNLLPLRSSPRPELRFTDYLRQRKGAVLDAYDHQQLTFGTLLKHLRLTRDPSRVPLVPVVLNLDWGMLDGVAFAGLTYELRNNPRAYEAFELFVNAIGTEQALTLEWSYNTALFRPETMGRFMAEFSDLLSRLIAQPEATLRELKAAAPTLDPAYQALNATTQPYPATSTLGHLLAAQAAATPQALALEQGSQRLTYGELDEQANRLAHYLHQQGVRPGHVVALALDRTPGLLVALLACLKCGAPYLPLDPTFPVERLSFMLADAQARLVLTDTDPPLPGPTPVHQLAEARQAAAALPAQAPELVLDSTSPLYLLYTSGSTGQPKGVVVSHRNVVNLLYSLQQTPGLAATDRVLAVTTISFDMSVYELFLPLLSGATIVLATAEQARDGRQLLALLSEARITALQTTPTRWRLLLDAGWQAPLPLMALCGGEALPLDLATRLLERCRCVWNVYGPTETTVYSTAKRVRAGEAVTIGRPIANTQLYVLDEHQRPVPPGEAGELCIAGDGVAAGYLGRPALTAERFLRNPFASQGGLLYRTGDLVQLLPSGEVLCLGRIDLQLKLRGYRIEPGEIEYALTSLPDVREAIVTIQEAQPGDERLVAHLLLADNAPAEEHRARTARWRTTLLRQLPTYMVPTEFVCLAQLPRTLNGKTDRAALARPATAPPPAAEAAFVEPRTDNERLVAAIWQKCLASAAPIGATDDFFASGGHSLVAVQVMLRLEEATGKRLPLATLFEHPTVAKLAALLEADSQPLTWSALVPIKPTGSKNPLYIVHGIGLNVLIFNVLPKHMDADQPVYGLQAQGLNSTEAPPSTIEEMAANYVAAIVAHNPTGPYSLAGYSYGGIIAYEMARQLLAAGRQVRFLGMFDTYATQPGTSSYPLVNAWHDWLFNARSVAYKAWVFAKSPRRLVRSLTKPARYRHLLEAVRYSKEERGQLFESQNGHPLAVKQLYAAAQLTYRLTPQPLQVHLFRNLEQICYLDDFEYLGWQPFALGGIKVLDIPGDHYTIFESPNDQACARAIQQALNACP